MNVSLKRTALLAGNILAGMYGSVAYAANIALESALPAISGVNGKAEIGGGWTDIDDLSSDEVFRGGAALSFPAGDMFGIQAASLTSSVLACWAAALWVLTKSQKTE